MITITPPKYITDVQGETISAIIPIDEYNELIKIAELYEEMEDIELYFEGKEEVEPAEPAEIVFKRIEEKRAKNE